jgi:hypothetical protein
VKLALHDPADFELRVVLEEHDLEGKKTKSLRPSFRFVSKWDTQHFHLKNMVVLSHGMEKNGFPILFLYQNFPFSVSQQLPTLQAYSNTSWL